MTAAQLPVDQQDDAKRAVWLPRVNSLHAVDPHRAAILEPWGMFESGRTPCAYGIRLILMWSTSFLVTASLKQRSYSVSELGRSTYLKPNDGHLY